MTYAEKGDTPLFPSSTLAIMHSRESGIHPDTIDPGRLAELDAYGVLDTVPEEGFDDVVHIARTICGAPVALVSLVAAGRQWFKARVGFQPCETDLNSSVCKYVLSEPDLLVIPDLTDDPRTSSNPLVTGEPYIRFYAGAPLRTPSGRVMGSLCVIDGEPRPEGLTEAQADALRRLARQVMILMRERQQVAQLRADEEQARAASIRRAAQVELGDHLRDVDTISEMTAKAAEIVGRTLGASRAGYGELDATGEFITIHQDWTTPGSASLVGRHRFADYGAIGETLDRGEILIVRAVTEDPRTADHAKPFTAINISAMLNVPVQVRGHTVGLFFVHSPEPRPWTPEEVTFARNVADRVQVGIGRLRAEDQQAVLNGELSHRLKNTLAIVQSIATQTLRTVTEREPVEAFERRVLALSRAHDVLLQQNWSAARMRDVMDGVLSLQAPLDRIILNGPDLDIGAQAALSLSMLLHELATNAVKYGALSNDTGTVSVSWRVAGDDGSEFVLDWIEGGGPAVVAPTGRGGFGTKLIRMGLLGSRQAVLHYDTAGLRAEFKAPSHEIQSH